ncbi:hypothetical protein NSED_00520 [Candidatus Nitrosopumilus sediminis]|uniref:Guanylate cyclase domain-containing protein n=2 Tax=Candidatus Nitrosopumilus sediminis TaxID=1229909 RepID=K0BC73_9ARCH|nr:hypothetical protein NSED_00520 [Candidatus Nitrosopumilus sediminis]
MEENKQTKDWLLDKTKIHHIKVDPTLTSFKILKKCPIKFLNSLLKSLQSNDYTYGDIEKFTRTYHWFFTDIVASATPKNVTIEQLQKIIVLNKLISQSDVFQKNKDYAALVPTGDGIAIGFPFSAEHPLQLAIDLHKGITKYNQNRKGRDRLSIRVGIETGSVYIIKSFTGYDNYWGSGIIMARRIMDTAGDMNIFTSKTFAEDARKLSREYKEIFHDIGEYGIKHGEKIKLCNVYGKGFGNRNSPRKTKIVNRQESIDDFRGPSSFRFNEVDIELVVKDPKTMLTHHTWTWKIESIAKEVRDVIFYTIAGDSKKDFADLNVKVTDRGKRLALDRIKKDEPKLKKFYIKFAKPIKPKQKRILKLEYDWEEPDREFSYNLASNCKKFSYKFSIPKDHPIESRIIHSVPNVGYEAYPSEPAKISYGKKNTVVTWKSTNLKANDEITHKW